jgi:hypothetical protein
MKTVNQTVQNAAKASMVALTENERTIFNIIVQNGTQSEGKNICADGESNGIELDSVYRVAVSKGKRITSVKGTLSRLQEKGLILMYGKDFECYFDGEVTEKGIEFYNNFSDTAKVLDTKENTKVTNMNTNDLTPAMDERIVRMNAILSTKLSAVSKSKRESLKAQKSSCEFLLDKWEDEESLNHFVSDNEIKESQYLLYCIALSRRDELRNKRVREEQQSAAKEAEKPKSETSHRKRAGKPCLERSVGEIHPNGKWVWTEYKEGKFDWRTLKDGRKERKPKSKTSTKKRTAPQEKKKLECTFEAFCEKAKKRSTRSLSGAQQEIRKLLLRGYKLQPTYGTNLCFLKKGGEATKSFPMDSVNSLFRKLGMAEIPNDMYESILINLGF